MIRSYRELIVWQKAMDFAEKTYLLVSDFPDDERFGLVHQLKKCAVSIPSNIAEGHTRRSTKDYLRFVSFALGSVAEAETQLLLVVRLGMAAPEQTTPLEDLLVEIGKMLRAIQGRLESAELRGSNTDYLWDEYTDVHPLTSES